MTHLVRPVAHLEDHDFDSQGNLVNPDIPRDQVVVVMAQASWCPHCTTAKPHFQEFANKHQGKMFCATIQADGDRESEKKLGQRMKKLKPNFRGFPDYMLFVGGKRVNKEVKGRNVEHLEEFSGV